MLGIASHATFLYLSETSAGLWSAQFEWELKKLKVATMIPLFVNFEFFLGI
jgi:hypothetical protein